MELEVRSGSLVIVIRGIPEGTVSSGVVESVRAVQAAQLAELVQPVSSPPVEDVKLEVVPEPKTGGGVVKKSGARKWSEDQRARFKASMKAHWDKKKR